MAAGWARRAAGRARLRRPTAPATGSALSWGVQLLQDLVGLPGVAVDVDDPPPLLVGELITGHALVGEPAAVVGGRVAALPPLVVPLEGRAAQAGEGGVAGAGLGPDLLGLAAQGGRLAGLVGAAGAVVPGVGAVLAHEEGAL